MAKTYQEINNLINQSKRALSKDQIAEGIELIEKLVHALDRNELLNELVIHSAGIERLDRFFRTQQIDWDTYNQGKNRILSALLRMLDQMSGLLQSLRRKQNRLAKKGEQVKKEHLQQLIERSTVAQDRVESINEHLHQVVDWMEELD